jgi:hypothetical protein
LVHPREMHCLYERRSKIEFMQNGFLTRVRMFSDV